MKLPAFIHAAALCAIATSPAYAYVTSIDAASIEKSAQSSDSVTLKTWKTQGWDATLSMQPIEDSLISRLGLPYSQPEYGRFSFVSDNLASGNGDDSFLFASQAAEQQPWRNDFRAGKAALVATFSQGDNFLQLTRGRTASNDFWLVEFWDAKKNPAENTAGKSPAQDSRAASRWKSWQDKNLKAVESPASPILAAAPEPAGLALIALPALLLIGTQRRRRGGGKHAI
jgi:hypothetical protein